MGYLVAPNVLSYVNGGYTGSEWSGYNLCLTCSTVTRPGLPRPPPSTLVTDVFVGGGVENNLEYLRHYGARLVHEDRVPRGLL